MTNVLSQKFGLALLCAALLGCADGPQPPSVILVSIDTLRADHVGLYGYERETTPFLDRWSTGATVFERAFTTAPWTLVAHMTMLTGLFPTQHGVTGRLRALSPEIPLLAERMRAAGYRTVGLHSPGWVDARHGFDRGFDLFRSHANLAEADRHLREVAGELEGGRPFFLFLHLFDVHCGPFSKTASVYTAPDEYEKMFLGADAKPLPAMPSEKLWASQGLLEAAQLETLTALYDGGIREVDDQLALWFDELERRGLLANTLTIVTSDHGEALGQRGRLDQHGEYWQEGLHVPLLVRHPAGLQAGTRVAQPVHLGDLVPTILATCSLPPDERLPGRSLFGPLPEQRLISGRATSVKKVPEYIIVNWPEKLVADRTGWCVSMDLEKDPGELAPVPSDAKRFGQLYGQALGTHEFPKPLRTVISKGEQESLNALGYASGDTEDDGESR